VRALARIFLSSLGLAFRTRTSLQLENLALRHQLTVYQRSDATPRIQPVDRLFWSWLSRVWSGWRGALVFVQPRTIIAWQRKRFRDHWSRLSGTTKPGRPSTSARIRQLIQRMSKANPQWGSPRIVGELAKIGIVVAKSTVEKYMVRKRKPPSPTWRAFLRSHVKDLVSIDFFVVPTIRFQVLFVLIVLAHHRRRVVHFGVTERPTAEWTAQQIVNAFPWHDAPGYLLRDGDSIYGAHFRKRVTNMGIEEVLTAPRSPWQSPFVERVIGSIRRDCLDHVIVLSQEHLRRILRSYFDYYHDWRTHLSLDMDCPQPRAVQPAEAGEIIEIPEVGCLHHHDEGRAA
jgi:putative transposase